MEPIDVKKIHLKINEIQIYQKKESEGMIISWSSDLGFGEYRIGKFKDSETKTDTWYGDSEGMDCNEDKAFLEELMALFVKEIQMG